MWSGIRAHAIERSKILLEAVKQARDLGAVDVHQGGDAAMLALEHFAPRLEQAAQEHVAAKMLRGTNVSSRPAPTLRA